MSELVRYDAMCSAIAECHAVDEVLDIKDKARALEVYYQQTQNIEAERKACEVRIRAERRVGALLRELERTTPQTANPSGRPTPKGGERVTPYARALTDNRISTQTASRYQRLAAVPEPEFEAAMNGDAKPSTVGVLDLARAADPPQRIRPDALWLWGRARDFEREGYAALDPRALLDNMTEAMRADMRRIAPALADFFGALHEATR